MLVPLLHLGLTYQNTFSDCLFVWQLPSIISQSHAQIPVSQVNVSNKWWTATSEDNVKQWLLKCKIQISTLPFIFSIIKGVGSVEKWRNNIGAGKKSRWHCAPVGSKRVEQMKNAWNFPFISVLKGKNAYMFTIHLELLFKFLDANNDTHKSIGTISYLYSLMSVLFTRNHVLFYSCEPKKPSLHNFLPEIMWF
jgi:hypothetical protein